MNLNTILLISVRVLTAIFVLSAAFLVLDANLRAMKRRRNARLIGGARQALNALVMKRDPQGVALQVLRNTPASLRSRLLVELSRSLSGASREDVSRIASELGLVDEARARLRSRYWWRRLHAARILQELEYEGRLFVPLLRDRHPAVRAQAAEWAAHYPAADVAEELVPLLDDHNTVSRYAVHDALLRMGTHSAAALTRWLQDRNGEDVIGALRVALALALPSFAEPAVRLCRDSEPEVRMLAVQLLGAVGGKDGTDAILACLRDEDARVRAGASRALGRIGHWPAATAVGALLCDPDWDVRQAAGLALRKMGSPGKLMLRQYRNSEDRFASDMARQIMDLPANVESGR